MVVRLSVLYLSLCVPLLAQPSEYAVKSACIARFPSFFTWPEGALPQEELVLGVLGDDPSGGEFERLDGRTVLGRRFVVRKFSNAQQALGACQLLYISASEEPRYDEIFRLLESAPILTIGESRGFADKGRGILRLYLSEDKVRFELNVDAARRRKLSPSSQVVKIAKVVKD